MKPTYRQGSDGYTLPHMDPFFEPVATMYIRLPNDFKEWPAIVGGTHVAAQVPCHPFIISTDHLCNQTSMESSQAGGHQVRFSVEGLTHLPLDKMAAILADDISKRILFNEKLRILVGISLKFVPKGPIDNK